MHKRLIKKADNKEGRGLYKKSTVVAILLLLISGIMLRLAHVSIVSSQANVKLTNSDSVVALFNYLPIIPYENVVVKFDASKSKSINGYITEYMWDFGDGSPPVTETDPITTHSYNYPGNYTVTLTVTDNIGRSNFCLKTITVIPYPSGPWADLYNQRGGEGLYEPSGNFAPSEKVQLYTLVTYNSEPVINKLVVFEVRDPTDATVLARSSETNEYGVAEVNFSIPVAGTPEKIIGTWTVFIVTSISEHTLSDTLTFRVTGIMIDVYTQKPDPYSGKGPNMPSDAFGPQEEVILYAYVTYDMEPVVYKMVAFEVIDPRGGVFYRTNTTDTNGIAVVKFRIPWPGTEDPTQLFGVWHVRAWVEVAGLVVEDRLTFKFGWIIEIKALRTVDYMGQNKSSFARGEHVFFNLTVTNIAFVSKVGTFTVTVYDAEGVPVGFAMVQGLAVSPGILETFIIDLQIPDWAFFGPSTAYANAYTSLPQYGGVPYCPEKSVFLTIT